MVAHAYNPSAWEDEVRGSPAKATQQVLSQPTVTECVLKKKRKGKAKAYSTNSN